MAIVAGTFAFIVAVSVAVVVVVIFVVVSCGGGGDVVGSDVNNYNTTRFGV